MDEINLHTDECEGSSVTIFIHPRRCFERGAMSNQEPTTGGLTTYFKGKIDSLEIVQRTKESNLRRLQAQNELDVIKRGM